MIKTQNMGLKYHTLIDKAKTVIYPQSLLLHVYQLYLFWYDLV